MAQIKDDNRPWRRDGKITGKDGVLEWEEAKILAAPDRKPGQPKLLVGRKEHHLAGSRDEDLMVLPGFPSISLFTGAGGMDIGLEQAGFTTLVQHEWSEDACATLICNRPEFFRYAALIQGDIRMTSAYDILGAAGLRVGECRVLTGGPPCQGFSTANTKSHTGTYDVRNDLVFDYLRIIQQVQPHNFVMENVPGFQKFNKTEYLKLFLRTAYDIGYELVYGLLDACDYGVPQRRCRFICMGTRRDLVILDGMLASMPAPTNFGPSDIKMIKTLDEVLAEELGLDGERQKLARIARPPGIRYFPDRPVLVTPAPNHDQDRSKSFMEFYDKLEKEEPDRVIRGPQDSLHSQLIITP